MLLCPRCSWSSLSPSPESSVWTAWTAKASLRRCGLTWCSLPVSELISMGSPAFRAHSLTISRTRNRVIPKRTRFPFCDTGPPLSMYSLSNSRVSGSHGSVLIRRCCFSRATTLSTDAPQPGQNRWDLLSLTLHSGQKRVIRVLRCSMVILPWLKLMSLTVSPRTSDTRQATK